MPHADQDVTALALERIEAARGRADAVPTVGEADTVLRRAMHDPDLDVLTVGGLRLAVETARADVPLLAAIAAAVVRLVAFAVERNGDWPWWGWTGEDGAGCLGCMADDDDLDDPIGFTDDWSAFPHEPECWAMQLDAAIRAAGEAHP